MRVSGVPFVQGRNGYSDSDGRKYGIAIHNTSNDATAEGEASYATRRTDGVSSHFYVDHDSVVQSLDTNVRAGHAGSRNGNENAIAFEITGTNAKSRAWWLANVAWDKLGRVLAVLCREYGIQPRRATVSEMRDNPKVRAFYGHDDMRRAWGGTTHTDPGDNFPWDHLFAVTKQAMTGEDDDMTPEEHSWLATIHKNMTVLDGRNPLGQIYTRMAMGEDALNPTYESSFPTLKVLGAQLTAMQTALLGAVEGLDTQQILDRIDQVAAAETARDAALAELVRAGQSGELTAEQVLVKLRDLLPAGTQG